PIGPHHLDLYHMCLPKVNRTWHGEVTLHEYLKIDQKKRSFENNLQIWNRASSNYTNWLRTIVPLVDFIVHMYMIEDMTIALPIKYAEEEEKKR
ncbi:hypothetical protein ACJX0J_035027, partial [Zea mays]